MPARLFACTPSRLAAFGCPRRYRMTYLDRPTPVRGAPWARTSMGASVHAVLQQWWALPFARRTPAAAVGLLRTGWSTAGFRDAEQSGQYRAVASRWIEGYVATLDPGVEPVGVERTVSTTTARLAVSGRVDRIDRRGADLVVVDYKTGSRVPTGEDAARSPALALYVLGVRRVFHADCTRVELHHLPTGTIAGHDHDARSLSGHVGRAEEVAARIVGATAGLRAGADPDAAFPPVTGAHCSWCDVRRHCSEGRAAAPERASWAGLPRPT